MNDAANDDSFKPNHYPTTDEAFGSTMNEGSSGVHPDDDIPF
jgi:replicative DNA helicase